jgi:hypothetical protein
MNVTDIRRYEMLVRVKEFGVAHADVFTATSLGGQTFAVVATAVDSLKSQLAAEAAGRNSGKNAVTSKAAARRALRNALEDINRTARAIAIDTPAIADKFKLPRSHGDQQLIAAARGFAREAAPFADKFITHNVPPTFVTDLDNATATLERSILDQSTVLEKNAAAKKAIRMALDTGYAAVQRLDAIVANRLRGDAEALTIWANTRRVSRIGVGSGRQTPSPAPAPAPAPQQATKTAA